MLGRVAAGVTAVLALKITDTSFENFLSADEADEKMQYGIQSALGGIGTVALAGMAGGAAIWLEFGTGVYYPDNYPGEKPSGIVAHGEYGKKENKGSTGDPWFYYDEKQGRFRITRGLPARAFMWQTATHLRNHFPELARKVWKG